MLLMIDEPSRSPAEQQEFKESGLAQLARGDETSPVNRRYKPQPPGMQPSIASARNGGITPSIQRGHDPATSQVWS